MPTYIHPSIHTYKHTCIHSCIHTHIRQSASHDRYRNNIIMNYEK